MIVADFQPVNLDTEHGKRKTVTSLDVVYALKRAGTSLVVLNRSTYSYIASLGKTLYGFGV